MLGRLLAATLASVALAVGAQQAGVLDGLEADSVALRFGLRGSEPSAAVAVVAIDDVTFSDLGEQWPFKRSLHAKAIDRLRAAGARQIVYDVQFTEPTTPREDLALYEAIERAGGAVLATTETDGHGGTNVLGGDENLRRIGAVAGAANLHTERGGNIRRFPHATGGLPSLAVAAAARMTGRPLSPRRFDPEGAWIDFTGPPGTVPTVSFSDVVEGRAAESMLRGRVVVVGTSAATLQDVHATPTASDRLMSGPEIQANAIDTALRGLPLRDAPGWLGVVTMLVLAALPGLAHLGGRGLRVAAVAPIAGLACLAFAQAAFVAGLVVSVAYPLFALVLATVATLATAFATERRARRRTAEYNEQLEERVRERTEELRETQLEVVRRLGQATESRDEETGAHIERISELALRLALKLGLDRGEAELIGHAAAMHDVGKIGIPDRVLHKPSTLDPDEWEVMRSHTTIGAALLSGSRTLLLQVAEAIALTHHERWDGLGYPAGLRGEDIPLAARITAVCDVFDALLSHRPYKRAWTLEATVAEIEAQRGRHFDPRVADAFLALVPELEPELTTRRDKPPMGILTLGAEAGRGQSTPPGTSERIHSRSSVPATRA